MTSPVPGAAVLLPKCVRVERRGDIEGENASGRILGKRDLFDNRENRWRNPLAAPSENLALDLLKPAGGEPYLSGKRKPVLVTPLLNSADDPAPRTRALQVVGERRKGLDDIFYVRGPPLPLDMSVLLPHPPALHRRSGDGAGAGPAARGARVAAPRPRALSA
jgi:hypothetical protein